MRCEDYWEGRYRRQGRIWGMEPAQAAHRAARLFRKPGARQVLVPGCGYGRNLGPLLRPGRARVEREMRVVGVDTSAAALALAREAVPDCLLCRADVCALPFAPASFDAVVALNLLHLLAPEECRQAAAEMRRVLRPGGLLALTVFSTADQAARRGTEVGGDTYRQADGKDVRLFSAGTLSATLRGFRVMEVAPYPELGPSEPRHYLWVAAIAE